MSLWMITEKKFKASGAAITINNFAEPVGKEYIRLSYQPIQTLPRETFTEERMEKLCQKSVDYINQAKIDPDVALKIMGIDIEREDIKLDGFADGNQIVSAIVIRWVCKKEKCRSTSKQSEKGCKLARFM